MEANAFKSPSDPLSDQDVAQMLQEMALNHEELEDYLAAQLQEIHKYKWIQSEHHHRDIGFQQAALDWIDQYGKKFFEYYWRNRIEALQTEQV